MKNFLSLLIMSVTLVFIACSDDEPVEKRVYQSKAIEGKWFCEDNATYLDFTNSSFRGSIYSDLEDISLESESLTGKWLYYPSNNILRMEVEYSISKYKESRDYKLVNVDDNVLTLFDVQFNTQYSFFRVIDEHEIAIGESFDINVSRFTPSSFSSVSPVIAGVDSRGKVEGTCAGTTFIRTSSVSDMVFVKVDVLRIPGYVSELFSTIDEVFERYGAPDVNEFYEDDVISNMMAGYETPTSLKDASMISVYYTYDENTREITQIQTFYKNVDAFKVDFSYIREHLYDVYKDGTVYGEFPGIVKNEYNIMAASNDVLGLVMYTNQIYLRENIHY